MDANFRNRERFICGGKCLWRMPSQEEIAHDLTTAPPPSLSGFVGTHNEAIAAGWQLAPLESWASWNGYRIPVYLCPECVRGNADG